jgi:hypothetical protein
VAWTTSRYERTLGALPGKERNTETRETDRRDHPESEAAVEGAESPGTVERRKDPERRATVDVALAIAEADAISGDYRCALLNLEAADQLSGGALTPRLAEMLARWQGPPG